MSLVLFSDFSCPFPPSAGHYLSFSLFPPQLTLISCYLADSFHLFSPLVRLVFNVPCFLAFCRIISFE